MNKVKMIITWNLNVENYTKVVENIAEEGGEEKKHINEKVDSGEARIETVKVGNPVSRQDLWNEE